MSLCPNDPESWLIGAAGRWKDEHGLSWQGREWTFDALLAEARGRVASLSSMGLRWGEPIAVIAGRSHCIATMLYTALLGGSPILPVIPTARSLTRLLAHCRIAQVVHGEEVIELPEHVRCFPVPPSLPSAPEPVVRPCRGLPDTVQLLLATSGTTGEPRVVMLSAPALAASADGSVKRLDLRPGDLWLDCLPLQHIGGLAILLRCLSAGACVLLHEGFDEVRVWQDLRRRAVTHLSLVPAMLWRLLEHCGDRPAPVALRKVLLGGGPVAASLLERSRAAGWPVCVGYGMTETSSHVALSCADEPDWSPGAVGCALPGVRIDVVEPAAESVDGSGRIRVRGPVLMSGYCEGDGNIGNGLEGDGEFLTGDVGRIDRRGRLHVLGRADEILVSGGINVHPAQVEKHLLRCPGVRDAAVTARNNPIWGEVLVALVTGEVKVQELVAWCRANLPSSIRPRELHIVDRLPRGSLGKLDRRTLRDIVRRMSSHPLNPRR